MTRPAPARVLAAVVLAVSVALAVAVVPLASSSPDGLERVARDEGFLQDERPHRVQQYAPLAGYTVPGFGDERAATAAAVAVGTLTVFAITLVLGAVPRVRRRRDASRTVRAP